MPWSDLIAQLNEIPMDRREEKAIFNDCEGSDWEIDARNIVKDTDEEYPLTDACNDGHDDCFQLTP